LDALGDVHDVAVGGGGDHHDQRFAAVGAGDRGGLLGGALDGGDLGEGHRGAGLLGLPLLLVLLRAVVGGDQHDLFEALDRIEVLAEHHVQGAFAVDHGAAGQGEPAGVQRGGDVVLGEAVLGQGVLVGRDPHDLVGGADHGDGGDARDALELGGDRGVEPAGEVGGLQVRGDGQHHGRQIARAARDDLRVRILGQLVLDAGQRGVDLVGGTGGVGAVGEL